MHRNRAAYVDAHMVGIDKLPDRIGRADIAATAGVHVRHLDDGDALHARMVAKLFCPFERRHLDIRCKYFSGGGFSFNYHIIEFTLQSWEGGAQYICAVKLK